MRSKFLFLCFFLLGSLTACKDAKWVDVPVGTPPEDAITGTPGESENPGDPDDPTQKELINCSYIRGDFFEFNRVSAESMAACDDLIFFAGRPYADGNVAFDLPVNDATLTGGATYEASYNGRNGVLKFDGTGLMNGRDGLLHSADEGSKLFTFATYLYIDEWVNGSFLFKKVSGGSTIAALQLAEVGKLKLTLGSATVTITNTSLTAGAWHYVSVDYNAGAVRLFVDDAAPIITNITSVVVPNNRVDFLIGENFKGRLDETSVWSVLAGTTGKNGITFGGPLWNTTKVLAYWKYDDATKLGKDSHTWIDRLNNIRTALNGKAGERKLRLGVAGGQWKTMVSNETARTKFATQIQEILQQYNFDGVDLDFEWPENAAEYDNYSKAIVKIRQVLGKNVFFTVSLHPVSYRITKEAINAVDFISYQCYGPGKNRFPIQQFKEDAAAAIAYGIPKKKLIMGVPFFGTAGKAGEQIGYFDMVTEGGLTDPSLDQITYTDKMGITKEYVFNGQNTIREKTKYTCENGFGGIMSWDLATDVPITDSKSLLKVVKEELDYYSNLPE